MRIESARVWIFPKVLAVLLLAGCSSSRFANSVFVVPAASPNIVQSGQTGVWRYFAYPGSPYPLQTGMVVGPDKNMWIADYESALIKVTMKAKTTVSTLPPVTIGGTSVTLLPTAMTVGSDGKFYMTTASSANGAGIIAVATTKGAVTAYSVPSGESPNGNAITLGPDDNVWFPEFSHIAKITTGGSITQYPYPTINGGSPSGVATGPDGNVWFTEHYNGRVAKIVPSTGKITEFPVKNSSSAQCVLTGIVNGGDGNLYAIGVDCIDNGYELLEVTTSGAASAHLLPSTFGSPTTQASDILLGPNGKIWIPHYNDNEIVVFDPVTANFSTINPPSPSTCSNCVMADGPDGNVWEAGVAYGVSIYLRKILTVTPTHLTFTGVGQTATLTATETGNPALSAASSNTAVATVAAKSANTFTVTAAGAGTANITVKDKIGNSFVVPATVQ